MSVISSLNSNFLTKVFASAALLCLFYAGTAFSQTYSESKPETIRTEDRLKDNGFRAEKIRMEIGADLITIFGKRDNGKEMPLLSVLRDTLGDETTHNDRLRYVWLHTYTKPSKIQRVASAVPFLYTPTASRKDVGSGPPPAVIDVQASDKALWNSIFWYAFKKVLTSEFGPLGKITSSQYRQNSGDHRKAAVAGALAVLSLYQELEGEQLLSDREMKDMQARLSLTDKALGWHMQSENLERVYDKEIFQTRDYRGHNWELLRQYAEAQDLFFEPLEMPDGTPRHAIVWTCVEDIEANQGRKFEKRFLNIKNPWTDKDLRDWKGHTQVRWFDGEDRVVPEGTPGSRSRTMIPLALYGLDNPKIPTILVDFRDRKNPKMREMSKRILTDVTSNLLSISKFSSFPYFMARFLYDFIPGRRGMDLNQTSRMRSYAQLKLLIALDDSLDDDFRNGIEKKIGSLSLNPMENEADDEIKLASKQYANLIAYANRPDGLAKKLTDDRRAEMTRLVHGKKRRVIYSIAHAFSFGLYTHRERSTPELMARLDMRRQLDFHERYLREVAAHSSDPSIDGDEVALRRSLEFINRSGLAAGGKTAAALGKIFSITRDDSLKELAVSGLYKINNSSAKKELLAIYSNKSIEDRWRDACARYLKLALQEGQRISKRDALTIESIAGRTSN